jgi:hypothetical protein
VADDAGDVTRIRLARSLPRLLIAPIVLAVAGAAAIVTGIVLGVGVLGIVLVVLGAIVVAVAIGASIVLLSVRLDVEEAAVRLSWFGGQRRYPLVPGPVTRVPLRGDRASKLRPRLGALGWGIGSARLRDEEDIELIRLAPTASAILVPTENGRVAIAAAREGDLLDALARAAQARQRQGPVAEATPAEPAPAVAEPAPPEPVATPLDAMDVAPTSLTGIERALLEERLARERSEAERAAEEARIAAARAEADVAAAAAVGSVAEPVRPDAVPARSRWRSALRPRASWVLALAPTIVAAGTWWIGRELGALPPAGTDMARLTSLALVLAGPATSIGAVMAIAWWPRLVGLVVAGGLAAAVLVGRSLVG